MKMGERSRSSHRTPESNDCRPTNKLSIYAASIIEQVSTTSVTSVRKKAIYTNMPSLFDGAFAGNDPSSVFFRFLVMASGEAYCDQVQVRARGEL